MLTSRWNPRPINRHLYAFGSKYIPLSSDGLILVEFFEHTHSLLGLNTNKYAPNRLISYDKLFHVANMLQGLILPVNDVFFMNPIYK